MSAVSSGPPPDELVLAQLEKLLHSKFFAGAERLKALLQFTVTEALKGTAGCLSESTISREVFGKRGAFDPRTDSTVRTAVRRLRIRLREYYEADGAADPILIDIPDGGYCPRYIARFDADPVTSDLQLSLSEPDLSTTESAPKRSWRFRSNRLFIFCTAAFCVLLAGAVVTTARWDLWKGNPPVQPNRPVVKRAAVAILAFRDLRGADTSYLPYALAEMFRTELATNTLRLISGEDVAARMKLELAPAIEGTLAKETLARIRKNTGADFLVLGSFLSTSGSASGKEQHLRFDVKVQNTETGEIIATATQTGPEDTLFSMVSNAGTVLRATMGVDGPIPSDSTRLRSSLPKNDEARRLYFDGLTKLRFFNAIEARHLLTRAVALEPGNPKIHAALAESWSLLGNENNAREAAAKALDLSTTVSPQEAILIEGRYYEIVRDWSRAIQIYQSLWTVFRDDAEYGLRLVNALTAAGRGKEALDRIADLRRLPTPLGNDPRIDLAEAATAEALGDFKREQAAAAAAALKAEAAGAHLIAAAARLRECWALDNLGQRQKALELAERARQTYSAAGDRAGEARALKNIGDVLDNDGKHFEGIKAYETALSIFRQIGHDTGVAVTLNNLGWALNNVGDFVSAEKRFAESVAVAQRLGDESRQAQALNGLAGLLWRKGRLVQAGEVYAQAVTHFRSIGDRSREAITLGNMGIVLQNSGQLAAADKVFEESRAILTQIGDKTGVARTVGNLGTLLLKKGNLHAARQRFEEQLAIGNELSEDKQRAFALHGLGEVLTAEGDLDAARAKFEEALALWIRMKQKGLAAETELALANVLLEQGYMQMAEARARAALDQFTIGKDTGNEALAAALLARCFAIQGKLSEAQKAAEVAAKQDNTDDWSVRIPVSIQYGRVHAAAGRTGEATRYLQAALQRAIRYGFIDVQLEARLTLGEVEADAGQAKGVNQLKALEKEAAALGFGLIQRKAAAILRNHVATRG